MVNATTLCPYCSSPVDTTRKPFVFRCVSCAKKWGRPDDPARIVGVK